MAVGVSKKISAASARAHTRRANKTSSSKFPSGIFTKVVLVLFFGTLAWAYQAIRPPPPKRCGSPEGPPVTGPRIKLRDGRYLAYKEHGVSKDVSKFKIIWIHGFYGSRYDLVLDQLSPEVAEELGIYIVSFDRPGYGESDPHPNRNLKSLALDVEELADQLGLGSKFHLIGFSMGGQLVWSCLKYIPHRLAGVSLLAPAVNYWWTGFPANLRKEGYNQLLLPDQWAIRIAHYVPWLTYWWNTQKWFPAFQAIAHNPDFFSPRDKEIIAKLFAEKGDKVQSNWRYITQQGESDSLHQDMTVAFGSWEFNPMDLENPFPNNEGFVHVWQGDEDRPVPVVLQRYITKKLPWIRYHELPGHGHEFPLTDGMFDTIVKLMFKVES